MTAWSFLEVNLFPSMDVEKENERIGDLVKKVNSDWKSQPDIEEGYIYDLKPEVWRGDVWEVWRYAHQYEEIWNLLYCG